MTHRLYGVLEFRISWCDHLNVTREAQVELNFWQKSLVHFNFQPICHTASALRVAYSDASDTGYGRYVIQHVPYLAYGQLSAVEAAKSSTWREICRMQNPPGSRVTCR